MTAKENCKQTHDYFMGQIKASSTLGQLKSLDDRIVKFYENGCLTAQQFAKLDCMLLDKQIKMELAQ